MSLEFESFILMKEFRRLFRTEEKGKLNFKNLCSESSITEKNIIIEKKSIYIYIRLNKHIIVITIIKITKRVLMQIWSKRNIEFTCI